MSKDAAPVPHPIFKWAGGKTSLLNVFDEGKYIPEKFETYYEPFFGAGSLYFHLWSKGVIKKAVLSDINDDLCNVYLLIKSDCEALIDYSKDINLDPGETIYYANRKRFNELKIIPIRKSSKEQKLERAILMMYLNKTCYSGMYRENKSGMFNVPCGKYKNPTIIDENNLYLVSNALSNATFKNKDYKDVLKMAKANDFVYLDPPYMPCKGVSHFIDYHRTGFNIEEQKRLCRRYKKLTKKGSKVMLSNSSSSELNKMYEKISGVEITTVSAMRLINQKNIGRTYVDEYIITNYKLMGD